MGKPLTDEVIYSLTDEQRLALQELAEIASKEFLLSQEVTELTEELRKSHQALGFNTSPSPRNLFEDPEIDVLITSRARFKIENVREQIRRSLKRAVEVGLGELDIIQRQCKIYSIPSHKRESKK